jgi:hypothetical protein
MRPGGPSTPKLLAGPDPTAPKGYVDGRSREVPSLRTANTKAFANPDGTITERVYSTAVNWQDGTGAWQPIDDTVSQGSDLRFHNASGPVGVTFGLTTAFNDLVSVREGALSATLSAPDGATQHSIGVPGGSAIRYPQVLPNVDLNYRAVGARSLRGQVVLNEPPGGSGDAV